MPLAFFSPAGGAARRPNNQFDLYIDAGAMHFSTPAAPSLKARSLFPRSEAASGSCWRNKFFLPHVLLCTSVCFHLDQSVVTSWRVCFLAPRVCVCVCQFAVSASLGAFPSPPKRGECGKTRAAV